MGRPSRNKRRDESENEKEKKSKIVKCKNCDHIGHNARTCEGGLTRKEPKTTKRFLVRNPTTRDQTKESE